MILIMTDDQGYGDFGFHGNPIIRTPNLDALARSSARMETFYVSPVCAPTRASLLTGRYNYRTRVVDTFVGRAMMEPEEVTLAEILQDAGYSTGIFGKWHLGDAYPMRPMDQGFDEALVHRGGGIGQPSDPPGGEARYTNPILFHNGTEQRYEGYCTDIYFTEALEWIRRQREAGRPFFAYLPTNAPHGPFGDVPGDLLAEYRAMDLSNDAFPQDVGHRVTEDMNLDVRARIFAMITNIDDNVGRLLGQLETMGLAENTLVLFLVDNGPDGRRYLAGMKGAKGTVYEGGIRSPLFLRWPARLAPGRTSDEPAAHIDVTPTLLDALGIDTPKGVRFDGRSFLPLLAGEDATLPDRALVIQSHRGEVPVRYHQFMIRDRRWKLLHASGFGRESFEGEPRFELYDLASDPLEMQNAVQEHPEVVARLKAAYDAWFDDVGSTRPDNYAKPRITVGTPHENPTVLTRQDWVHERGIPWGANSNGRWLLQVFEAGGYEIVVRYPPVDAGGEIVVGAGKRVQSRPLVARDSLTRFDSIQLEAGPLDLMVDLAYGEVRKGPWQVEVRKIAR